MYWDVPTHQTQGWVPSSKQNRHGCHSLKSPGVEGRNCLLNLYVAPAILYIFGEEMNEERTSELEMHVT